MAIIDKNKDKTSNKPINRPSFTISDTEFLLKLIADSKIQGRDLNQAISTIQKIQDLHTSMLNTEKEV